LYSGIIKFLKYYKIRFAIFLLLLIVISCFFAGKASFKSTVFDFIPESPSLRKSLRLLEHLRKSSEIIIHITSETKEDSLNIMTAEIDELKSVLDADNFKVKEFCDASFLNDYETLFNYIPLVFSKDYEDYLKEKISADNILKQMKNNYKTLLSPIGTFQKKIIKDDPLFIGGYLLGKLKDFSKILGSGVIMENGYLLSKDYKHAFLIVSNSDSELIRTSSQIICDLNIILNDLDKSFKTEVISSHVHSSFNEQLIKKDARRAVILAVVALLLIILFLFKDINGFLVFLIPSCSFFPAILVLNLFFERVSLITVGFGAMIIGISIDYGIHIFSSIKNSSINNEGKYMEAIFKPLLLSLSSTLVAFSLFFISSSEGYRQLALFAVISISFTFVFSIFILPVFVRTKSEGTKNLSFQPLKSRWFIITGVIVFIVISILSFKSHFEHSIRVFDNTPIKVFKAEERFMDIFGKNSIPLIMSTGSSLEIALQNEEEIAPEIKEGAFTSTLIPSEKRRIENINRWNSFFDKNKDVIKKDFLKAVSETGFSKKSFDNFINKLDRVNLNKISTPVFIKEIASSSIVKGLDKVDIISYLFREDKISDVKNVLSKHSGSFLFFRKNFLKDISDSTFKELKYLLFVIIILVSLFFIILPCRQELFLVFIPVIIGVLVPLAVLSSYGKSVNAAHIAGLIIVSGLCVDYGVFMLFQLKYQNSSHIYQGIKISVITTFCFIIGKTLYTVFFGLFYFLWCFRRVSCSNNFTSFNLFLF